MGIASTHVNSIGGRRGPASRGLSGRLPTRAAPIYGTIAGVGTDERAANATSGPVRTEGGAPVVLIVDDEAQLRRSAARILNASGFETLQAANGREAIEIFRERGAAIGAVLLDMAMPELGGKQTFLELRRLRPDACVVLSSGYDEIEALHRFESAGLSGFLQKPYSAAELVSCIREAMVRASGAR